MATGGYDSYSDSAAPSEASGTDDETSGKTDEKTEDSEDTALVPKSIFGGHDCKPGDRYTVEVVHSYEDDLEIKLAGKSSDKGEPEPGMDDVSLKE